MTTSPTLSRPASVNSLSLPTSLSVWLAIMLLGSLLSGIVAAHEIAQPPFHQISSLPHRFDDFMVYWHRLLLVHHTAFYTAPDGDTFGSHWGYPAPAIWIYRFFYLVDRPAVVHPTHGFALMAAVIIGGIAFAGLVFWRALRRLGLRPVSSLLLAGVSAFLTWPFLFGIQRGNVELLLWLPLAAAIWAFYRRHFTLAAVLIGVAAAAKIYPLILLALFLPFRRFLDIGLAIAITVLITIVSLWYIGPTLPYAIHHLGLGVSTFLQTHGEGMNWSTEGFNHSFFHLIKIAVAHRDDTADLASILPRYMGIIALVMLAIYFLRVIRLPLLNQLAVLTISMAYLPATSYDYTLQILLLPWAALVLIVLRRRALRLPTLRGTSTAIVLFGLILAPELFLTNGVYCHSGTLKSVCLGLLLALACITPWPDPDHPEPRPTHAI